MRFGLIGAAAYIAPRHMAAINTTGNELVAALDLYDNVGVLDTYAPECKFFKEFERFDRFVDKCRRRGEPLDWLSICSPNYLHDSHIRLGLRSDLDVVCEKPLVLAPWNLDGLSELEAESGRRVWTVLQLRYHEELLRLKDRVNTSHDHDICLTYLTPRGPWFNVSWKGSDKLAGGIITNIGIHFLDVLMWIFGEYKAVKIHYADPHRIAGYLELESARVKWFLSTSFQDVIREKRRRGVNGNAIRDLIVNGEQIDLSHNFRELHTEVYRKILEGHGHGIEDSRPSITLAHKIQTIKDRITWPDRDFYATAHPLATRFVQS